jgi:hypothetical protein
MEIGGTVTEVVYNFLTCLAQPLEIYDVSSDSINNSIIMTIITAIICRRPALIPFLFAVLNPVNFTLRHGWMHPKHRQALRKIQACPSTV